MNLYGHISNASKWTREIRFSRKHWTPRCAWYPPIPRQASLTRFIRADARWRNDSPMD